MNREQLMNENKIATAFKLIDMDGDGFISKNDMEQAFGSLDMKVCLTLIDLDGVREGV